MMTSPRLAATAAVALLFAGLCLPGCGSGTKKHRTAADAPDSDVGDSDDSEPTGDVLIPAEKLDEIKNFFDRKARLVTRCFTDAIDAGEISQRATGRTTVTMTITTSGKLQNVRIAESKPPSKVLEECVVDAVSRWTITTLPKPLDYSYTFGFDTL